MNLENERTFNYRQNYCFLNSCNFKNSTSCISENNSKFIQLYKNLTKFKKNLYGKLAILK